MTFNRWFELDVHIPDATLHRLKRIKYFSIYTLSDFGDLSNLIGSLSRTIQQYSPPSEWIMCELGFFPVSVKNAYDLRRIQNGALQFTIIAEFCARWIVYKLPFIRVEEAVSWTQRFLTRKIWPKNEVYLWQTNLKANVCRNSTFQVNTRKNATWRRRLTSRNRIAIFVSTSCEEQHNKPFWL